MKRLQIIAFILLSFPQFSAAEEINLSAITTSEMLFDFLGDSAVETAFIDQGMEFTHYYYEEQNRSFLVNDEIGEVCHTYEGEAVLSCFPCKENEVSDVCP